MRSATDLSKQSHLEKWTVHSSHTRMPKRLEVERWNLWSCVGSMSARISFTWNWMLDGNIHVSIWIHWRRRWMHQASSYLPTRIYNKQLDRFLCSNQFSLSSGKSTGKWSVYQIHSQMSSGNYQSWNAVPRTPTKDSTTWTTKPSNYCSNYKTKIVAFLSSWFLSIQWSVLPMPRDLQPVQFTMCRQKHRMQLHTVRISSQLTNHCQRLL